MEGLRIAKVAVILGWGLWFKVFGGKSVREMYSSKAFRVYNLETKRVKENLHINFLENEPNVAGKGPTWLFDLAYLTDSMNYQPITTENKANHTAGPKEANNNAEKNGDKKLNEDIDSKINKELVDQEGQAFLEDLERLKRQEKDANDAAETLRKTFSQNTEDLLLQVGVARASSTNFVNTASTSVNVASIPTSQDDSQIPSLEDIYDHSRDGIHTSASYDDEGAKADFTNLETTVNDKKDIMLVQVYVDDIIFGSTKKSWCDEFEAFMKNRFLMSFMGELTFFLRLQVKKKEDGIFISHDKYVAKILKKFDFLSVKTACTPIETKKPLVNDEEAADMDVYFIDPSLVL
nr:ribonuclease H-like domain, reverse transcriptase, RNA-dependent DNA polymerase [Tanacetum cinerariifolium]